MILDPCQMSAARIVRNGSLIEKKISIPRIEKSTNFASRSKCKGMWRLLFNLIRFRLALYNSHDRREI